MCKNIIYLCLAVVLSFVVQAQALTVVVDGGTQYQIIEGWGACLYPDTHAESDLYLDQRWRDGFRNAGMNIIRLNVTPIIFLADGGTLEGPEVPLTGDLATDAAKFDFEQQYFRYSDDLAAWLSQNALEPSRVKILGGIWSIPHWAKAPTGNFLSNGQWSGGTPVIMYGDLGCTCGGTWDTGIYVEDRYQYCARWLAAFCYGFEQHSGVPLYGLSIQNEVGYEMLFDSCTLYHIAKAQKGTRQNNEVTMDYNVYANALKAVKDNWPAELSNVKLMGPHHAGLDDYPASPWGLLWQTSGVQAVKDHADATLIDFLDVYTHNYGVVAPAKRAEMFEAHWNGIDAQPDEGWGSEWGGNPYWPPTMHDGVAADGKQIWNSEFGGHDPAWPGPLDLALDMHIQTVRGHESAMVYWQFCSHGNSGGSVHELVSTSELDDCHQSLKYCAFKQFSRYIRPGATRVQATFNESGWPCYGTSYELDDDQSINVSAFVHGVDGRVTVVLVNMTTTSHPVDIVLPSSPSVSSCNVYRTSSSDHYVLVGNVPVSGGVVSVTVPGESVVTVTGVGAGENVAPVANDDSYSTPMDTTLNVAAPGVLGNDTDDNGDPLTAIKVSDPSHGSVTLNSDGSFSYTPDGGYTGADSFTYKANDGELDSNVATVNINVTAGNEPPVANDDAYSTDKDTTLNVDAPGVLANDTDPEENPLTAVKMSDPSHGSVTLNSDGSFSYTPDSGYEGQDTFTYVANDGLADSNTATVTITVVGAGTTMHVVDVAPRVEPSEGKNRYEMYVNVLVQDEFDQTVEGATVYVHFTADEGTESDASGVTGADGWAMHIWGGVVRNMVSFTACVTDVTHATMTYDPAQNVETCDSASR